MAQPLYILTSSDRRRLAEVLHAEKVERLFVSAGEPGDKQVDVFLEHTPDYKPANCTDRYGVTQGTDNNFTVTRQLCPNSSSILTNPEVVEAEKHRNHWLALHALFIPDAKAIFPPNPLWTKANLAPMNWDFANPKFDPIRHAMAVSTTDASKSRNLESITTLEKIDWKGNGELWESWQSLARFMEPIEKQLLEIVGMWNGDALPLHMPTFAALIQGPQSASDSEALNVFLGLIFSENDLDSFSQKIRQSIFSEYPFLPPAQLGQATSVMVDWVCRRILWDAVFREKQNQRIKKNDTKEPPFSLESLKKLDISQSDFFQLRLQEIFMNPALTTKDIEELRRGCQVAFWVLQERAMSREFFASTEMMAAFEKQAERQFNTYVAEPAFKKMLDQFGGWDEAQKKIVSGRLHSMLEIPAGKILNEESIPARTKPYSWTRFNTALRSDNKWSAFPSELESDPNVRNVAQTKIRETIVAGVAGNPYRLESPKAIDLIYSLKDLHQKGIAKMEQGVALKQMVYLLAGDARRYLQALLKEGEGDHLDIDLQARHILELSLLTDFATYSEEKPFWKNPWIMGGAGVVAAGGVLAALLLLSDEERKPSAANNGLGNGPGNGDGPSDDEPPIGPSGRGTPTTVGP